MNSTNNNTGTPAIIQGFVRGPDGRGTLGIISPCLFILFLSGYAVLHLNIPSEETKKGGLFLYHFKYAFMVILVPDGMVTTAFSQWREARSSIERMQTVAPWWTILHGFYAEMGGFRVQDDSDGQQYVFRSKQLLWLAEKNILQLPHISEHEIKHRSKSSGLAKGLACLQSAWFLLGTGARVYQKLALTTLEIATIPFIGCTWLMYYFWWHKPFDLETFTTIHVERLNMENLRNLAEATCFEDKSLWYRPVQRDAHSRKWDFYWFENTVDLRKFSVVRVNHKIPYELYTLVMNSASESRVCHWYMGAVNNIIGSDWDMVDDVMIFVVGLVFNGFHLFAWHNVFPTKIESVLWKVSVCTILGCITFWVPVSASVMWLPSGSVRRELPFWVLMLTYAFVRAYLIIEIFLGLRVEAASIYETPNWFNSIPHVFG